MRYNKFGKCFGNALYSLHAVREAFALYLNACYTYVFCLLKSLMVNRNNSFGTLIFSVVTVLL